MVPMAAMAVIVSRMNAKCAINRADTRANGAADNRAHGASGPAAFMSALLSPAHKTLGLCAERHESGEKTKDKSKAHHFMNSSIVPRGSRVHFRTSMAKVGCI